MEIQAVAGMNDVLPEQMSAWQHVLGIVRELMDTYGYRELLVPIVEHTQLFKRAIGETTDVVEKEMYTFTDQGEVSLTLRPEATAGVMRALISNGRLRGARHKLWCWGPMFRHESTQRGRYRQFYQVDVEAVGFPGPDVDIELIALTARLWRRLGVERVWLHLNSLGTPESRRGYREELVGYFRAHQSQLDADSLRRLERNPLRILDSKNPDLQELIARAPLLTDHLDPESRAHFETLCSTLKAIGVPFEVNPRLVRGLDYYSRTVFEWVTDALGPTQNAVCSGGRYDGLIAQLGGAATPGVGFAMGVERVIDLLTTANRLPPAPTPDVYVVVNGQAGAAALALIEQLREALPQRRIELNMGGGKFKSQFSRADQSGARLALIIGEDELARGVVALKPLRRESGQSECPTHELAARVEAALAS